MPTFIDELFLALLSNPAYDYLTSFFWRYYTIFPFSRYIDLLLPSNSLLSEKFKPCGRNCSLIALFLLPPAAAFYYCSCCCRKENFIFAPRYWMFQTIEVPRKESWSLYCAHLRGVDLFHCVRIALFFFSLHRLSVVRIQRRYGLRYCWSSQSYCEIRLWLLNAITRHLFTFQCRR